MKRTLGDAARVIGGELKGEDRPYGCVSTDSRTLKPGALFVALRGPNFDGGAFVQAAAAQGAIGAVVERAVVERTVPGALPQLVVADALQALQALAFHWRANFTLPVVAVAGSNGKTTAKEMTAAILSRKGPCMATHGNFNNHIGVPVTLMRLESSHRSAVIEMGANRIGDVAQLMRIAQPTVGLITNAGAEHLEGFGNLDGVAKGEGEAVSHLGPDGTAVINADDAYAGYWRGVAGAQRMVSFGVHSQADFTAKNVFQGIERGEFATRFTLSCPLGERAIMLKAGGAHNIGNALAAAAGASAAGASLEDIALGLADFRAVAGRLQLKAGTRGSWIIDDSYNANPSSVRAGLEVLRALSGATWLVLGDMAELGESSEDSHAHIGAYARDCGIKRLFAVGPLSTRAVETFGSGAEWFADADSLTRRLQAELSPGVTVLIKGSRINRLERVVQAVTGGGAGAGPMMRAS
ncbi:MAG TPA: UDP-N-acetylmuramoyl-tripeptide--D-alanyl-D-alanine ligase [Steroidobacteraceae bacterium]|jgi:UDP-N-acetylmuramoyl-tripeptide--D-alanyl-D-alanine ligase|nr:UDP-N-acetylmuramoyl-tripeptide--D-alanyl-D-alanine ligase [Steroidobacteraceae bacterium]